MLSYSRYLMFLYGSWSTNRTHQIFEPSPLPSVRKPRHQRRARGGRSPPRRLVSDVEVRAGAQLRFRAWI